MLNDNYQIFLFEPQSATDDDWERFNQFTTQIQLETMPDDPPRPVHETRRLWLNIPSIVQRKAWLMSRPDQAVVAMGWSEIFTEGNNQHLLSLHIAVLPEVRQQGAARQLLGYLYDYGRQHNRRLALFETNGRVPAGAAFMDRLGATAGIAGHVNQLNLAELNLPLLQQWIERAAERATDYQLGLWDGPYPPEVLPAIVKVKEAMNEAPIDNLEVEDFDWTPEQLAQLDQTMIQRGVGRWTIYAQHKGNGDLAGYTEIFWDPSKPHIAQQGDTAVLKAHQNHGLGRWLKATMLQKVMSDRPGTKFVRTSNADSNAPMRKINHELGFKPYRANTIWQIELNQIATYLAH